MPKQLQLDISQPCHEDWNKMTDMEKGKFCGSCQKQVIDFIGMNDQQLIAFFRKPSTGSVCGRFMSDQLQREIILPKKRIPWFNYFFQIALPAFVLSIKAKGQDFDSAMVKGKIVSYFSHPVPARKELPELFSSSKVIQGRVVDANDNPVPFASIQLGERGIAADSNGYFMFDKAWLTGTSVIEISSVGFELKTVAANTILTDKQMVVRMNDAKVIKGVDLISFSSIKCSRIVVGGAMTVRSYVDKWDVKSLIPWSIAKDSVNVYPNPVRSGNPVTIEVSKSGKQKTTVELFSVTGQLVYSTQINMASNAWKAAIPLPKLTTGTYVMRVSRGEKEKPYSTKIIMQ